MYLNTLYVEHKIFFFFLTNENNIKYAKGRFSKTDRSIETILISITFKLNYPYMKNSL